VTPTSRRIFLYWLLLLVPTLVVGAVAVQLLRRERARLAERATYADEARRAAVTARASLIVENAELLVGDVETGLLDTLATAPAPDLDGFLDQWEKTNPLVRTAFRCAFDGRVLRPAADTTDENARGFLRRFARRLAEPPPWSEQTVVQAAADRLQAAPSLERQKADSNFAQVQSARRDVQNLSKARSSYAAGESALDIRRERAAAPAAKDVAAVVTPERRAWLPWTVENRLHLLGWVQPAGAGEVRGVELERAALISRLGGALPVESGAGEGYALRDDRGRVLHQAGAVPRAGAPLVRVPLSAALLPGWEVVAFLAAPPGESGGGAGFLVIGSLLVGILLVAILAGGSLLLWQARRSGAEAAQKTSFVANVSHEFKTPLTTIRLYAELLEQGRVRDAAQGGEYLRTIGREVQRLARLVNNVLDFSRLEQGRKKYAREPLDLAAELARLLDAQAPRLVEAGLTLRRELPASPLPLTTDRDAVGQIVLNLLDNACKYAAGGGEVTVALLPRPAGGAILSVLDRGPGVPPAHRERIFEKFHRVDDTLTAEKTGAGLGLSIARQLARGLGGDLRCEPRVGGGAAFLLELP
jgi:signal transduction histidine kinase